MTTYEPLRATFQPQVRCAIQAADRCSRPGLRDTDANRTIFTSS